MATYVDIAQALAEAGYLSDADVVAAAAVLEDALIVEQAEDAESAAIADIRVQDAVIARAEDAADYDAALGDDEDESVQEMIIDQAMDAEFEDKNILKNAEAVIDAAYADAANALLAAELIDAANLDNAIVVIRNAWAG